MRQQKKLVIAYILWFFFGAIGAHRFYLSQYKSAFAMIVLGVAVLLSHFAMPIVIVYGAWWLFDALLIPGYVDAAADHSMIQIVTEHKEEKDPNAAPPPKFVEIQELHDLNAQYLATATRGDLEGAIKEATGALAICEGQLGAENGHAALIRYNLGEFYRRSGNKPQAISMFKSAIAIQEQFLDEDISPEQAQNNLCRSINGLAQVYASLGEVQDAKKLYRCIIDTLLINETTKNGMAAKKTDQYYVNYANALNNLAKLYTDKGQAEQAQSFFTEATTLLDHFPDESTEIKVDIMINNATNESALLNYERAEKLFERAIKIIEEQEYSLSNTSDIPDDEESTALLATVDDAKIAEPTIAHEDHHLSHADQEKLRATALQRNQLQLASCHNGLGIIYANQSRLKESEEELVAAGKIRKQILPSTDPEFLAGLSHLSLVYYKQAKLSKAEAISKLILAARVEAQGAEHDDTLRARRNLEHIQAEMSKEA